MILASFGVMFILVVSIGLLSHRKSKHTVYDYFSADRSISPFLVAVSASATNHSGFMFIGQVGFIVEFGFQALWITIGWKIGDFISFFFIHQRFCREAEKYAAVDYIDLISRWNGNNFSLFRKIASIISLVFLCMYAAAQFNAGSKALEVLFDVDYRFGALVSAGTVFLYSFRGGMRASIWTDALQALFMFITLSFMLCIVLHEIGGIQSFINAVKNVSPTYMHLFPETFVVGKNYEPIFFVVGWVFGGLGTIGQPHIMSRFLTLEDAGKIWKTRLYYYALSVSFSCIIIPLALGARIVLGPDLVDAELALPILASRLLPDVLLGTFLAGIFAATLSTADSQILAASSSLSNNFSKKYHNVKFGQISVFVVILITLIIALLQLENVFNLVLMSWSALASVFAPLLIILAMGKNPTEQQALATMFFGLIAMLIWRYFGLSGIIYDSAVGISSGLLFFSLLSFVENVGYKKY